MREYLFRGKDRRFHKWCEGLLGIIEGKGPSIGVRSRYSPDTRDWELADYYENNPVYNTVYHYVIPETVGQFTGLLDKNGKKIFEGDIVRAMMDYGPAGMLETVTTIEYDLKEGYRWQYLDLDTIEVIGNIYDNPELLPAHIEEG